MNKKKSRLESAHHQAERAIKMVNEKIAELGVNTKQLYEHLNTIQKLFDDIRNIPSEKWLEHEKLKEIRLHWKQQAKKIESDYKNASAKKAGTGAAGIGMGVAVASLGPTAAMGIATTFGIASTGTAISTLGGAAATNAALAWLGGGALAAGGGGIAAGKFLLTLAGPVGWTIAGISFVGSGLLLWKGKNNQKRLENIFTLISERDVQSYKLAIVEINERISRIKDECEKLNCAIERIRGFGLDYNSMKEEEQYELGSYVNLMNSSTQLLINPIIGLSPKYTIDDLKKYLVTNKMELTDKQEVLVISLSNLLYKIGLDEKDQMLLWQSFKRNKDFLSSIEMSKSNFEFSIIETVADVLDHKYRLEEIS